MGKHVCPSGVTKDFLGSEGSRWGGLYVEDVFADSIQLKKSLNVSKECVVENLTLINRSSVPTSDVNDRSKTIANTEFVQRLVDQAKKENEIDPKFFQELNNFKVRLPPIEAAIERIKKELLTKYPNVKGEKLKEYVVQLQSEMQDKQDKGDYARLVDGKVPKNELPNLKSWMEGEEIKTGSMEVWIYD